jgi:hypothetical protein
MRAKRKWASHAREIGAAGKCGGADPKKDGAPVPGSPGLQAISFNTSCEIEIADTVMQAAGQLGSGVDRGAKIPISREIGRGSGLRLA